MCRAVPMDQELWRADVKLGPRDQEAGWPTVVANIWDIDKRKCTCEWPCWLSQDDGRASRTELRRTWRTAGQGLRWHVSSGGGRVWSMLLEGGLVVWTSKPSVADFAGLGLKTWAEIPRKNRWHVVASRSSCRGEAILWKMRWSLVEEKFGRIYPWQVFGMST
jgi:hypothetical protein